MRKLTWGVAAASAFLCAGVLAASWAALQPKFGISSLSSIPQARQELFAVLIRSNLPEARLIGVPVLPLERNVHPHRSRQVIRNFYTNLSKSSVREKARDRALVELIAQNWTKAISILEEAAVRNASDAFVLNDVAAAYFSRGIESQQPHDLARALSNIDRALVISPGQPEALFNRALIMEHLWMLKGADLAWAKYLEKEREPPWAQLAQQKKRDLHWLLVRLENNNPNDARQLLEKAVLSENPGSLWPAVERNPQVARTYVEESILSLWASQALQGNKEVSDRWLAVGKSIADVLLWRSGDRLLYSELLRLSTADITHQGELIRGHLAYGEGRSLLKARRISEAKSVMIQAQRLLSAAESDFGLWATFHLAACSYFEKNYDDTERQLSILEDRLGQRSYRSLIGRMFWLKGLVYLEQSEAARSLKYFDLALTQFVATGELGNQGAILSLIAHAYEVLGDVSHAWKFRLRGIEAALRAQESSRLPVVYAEAVRASVREQELGVALSYQSEVLGAELKTGDSLAISEAYWRRSRIHQSSGHIEACLGDLKRAWFYCNKISHSGTRRHVSAGILVAEGAALRVTEPARAVDSLSRGLNIYAGEGFEYLRGEILLERAKAFRSLGRPDDAEEDLNASLNFYEAKANNTDDADLQISYFEQSRETFEELLMLHLRERKSVQTAFRTLERSRSRWLRGKVDNSTLTNCSPSWLPGNLSVPLNGRESSTCIPSDVVLLEYLVLSKSLLIWVVTSSDIRVIEMPLDESWLRRSIETLLTRVQLGSAYESLAELLYEKVFSPVLPFVKGYKNLVFVPDKSFHALPFAILRNPQSGRFLIEDFRISVAPSAEIYLYALRQVRKTKTSSKLSSMLAIGNPGLSQKEFPQLENLGKAEHEVLRLALLYPKSKVLAGNEATKENFFKEINRYDIIHFAGHTTSCRAMPSRRCLLFASSGESSGELDTYDLARLRLSVPGLLFLSACSTSAGRDLGLEGMDNLARSFLAAGIPIVIGSLWNTEDVISSELSRRFYAALDRELSPADALRESQLSLLKEQDRRLSAPASWAAFQLIGAAD